MAAPQVTIRTPILVPGGVLGALFRRLFLT